MAHSIYPNIRHVCLCVGGECQTTDRDHQLISQIWLHLFKPRPAHTPATRVQVARSIDLYQYVLDLTSGAAVILELGLVYFPSPMCTAAPCRSPGVIHIFVDMFIYCMPISNTDPPLNPTTLWHNPTWAAFAISPPVSGLACPPPENSRCRKKHPHGQSLQDAVAGAPADPPRTTRTRAMPT